MYVDVTSAHIKSHPADVFLHMEGTLFMVNIRKQVPPSLFSPECEVNKGIRWHGIANKVDAILPHPLHVISHCVQPLFVIDLYLTREDKLFHPIRHKFYSSHLFFSLCPQKVRFPHLSLLILPPELPLYYFFEHFKLTSDQTCDDV